VAYHVPPDAVPNYKSPALPESLMVGSVPYDARAQVVPEADVVGIYITITKIKTGTRSF
jgi:hypothetical protein